MEIIAEAEKIAGEIVADVEGITTGNAGPGYPNRPRIIMDRFLICLPFTLAQEAPFPTDWTNPHNFSNDAHDPGGKTYMGIIQREYDTYRKSKGESTQDIRHITQAEGEDIYRNSYWLPDCPNLSAGLDMVFFDSAVNEGVTEAIKILQFSLGIANDGKWGPLTSQTVSTYKNIGQAIHNFTARRKTVYQEMPGFKYFGDDWIRRSTQIGTEAVAMIEPATP